MPPKKILVLLLFIFGLAVSAEYKLLKAEKAVIHLSDNTYIMGSFYPVKIANPPAVILLHTLGRNRGDWNNYARYLQKEGIAVLSIDFRGHGESAAYSKTIWRKFNNQDYVKLIDDMQSVYAFLIEKFGVAPERVGILGVNIGANVAINFAARQKKISSVVLIRPGFDYKGIKVQPAIEEYGARPVYLLCSNFDAYSKKTVQELQKSAQGKVKTDFFNYRENWVFLINNKKEVQNTILSWFKETLLVENSVENTFDEQESDQEKP